MHTCTHTMHKGDLEGKARDLDPALAPYEKGGAKHGWGQRWEKKKGVDYFQNILLPGVFTGFKIKIFH